MIDVDELVNRFLSWKLPNSVCSDGCVTIANYKAATGFERTGTNLLTANEAKQMLEYLLADYISQPVEAGVKHANGGRPYLGIIPRSPKITFREETILKLLNATEIYMKLEDKNNKEIAGLIDIMQDEFDVTSPQYLILQEAVSRLSV